MSNVASTVSAVVAVGSAGIATMALRGQRRSGSSQAFLAISDAFEGPDLRSHRRTIYTLDRDAFESWDDSQREAVDAWCAHIDRAAVLVLGRHIDPIAFLNMYGDVTLRTMYQVAPYCNSQVQKRGNQFMLPTRELLGSLTRLWQRQARRGHYPRVIGFPALPKVRLTPHIMKSDWALQVFSIGRRRWRW